MDETFQVVSDDLRATTRAGMGRPPTARTSALLAGKTILVASRAGSRGSAFWRKKGLRLRTRRVAHGTIMWTEPLEASDVQD